MTLCAYDKKITDDDYDRCHDNYDGDYGNFDDNDDKNYWEKNIYVCMNTDIVNSDAHLRGVIFWCTFKRCDRTSRKQ